MEIIKSTARLPTVCKAVLYIFCLGTAQAMTRLIIVFVSREEWSTATTVIETNYKATNLIPITLAEDSNFWCRLYHRDEIFSKCEHRKRKWTISLISCLQKIQCSVSSFKPGYPTAKPKTYQQDITVGGGFNSLKESFRNGSEFD